MPKYEPKTLEEIIKIVSSAKEKGTSISTVDSLSELTDSRLLISFDSFNKIIELDLENLIAQVERGVTLGELEQCVGAKGLMFAPYTPDQRDLTVGEMYSRQSGSLTGLKYGLPKFHVMGLEVVLANGKVIKTGGKTVKNVTGYDLTRMFISSRDTIGLPVVYTLKLLPREETCIYYLINLSDSRKLQMLLNEMIENKILPAVCCFWDASAMQLIQKETAGSVEVFLGLAGIKEKVEQDVKKITESVRKINLNMHSLEKSALDEIWETIAALRKNCSWHECFKIFPSKLGHLMEDVQEIDGIRPGLWGNPLQGKINMLLPENGANEERYQRLAGVVKELGGATNWYYDSKYGLENPLLKEISQKVKNTFDPDDIFSLI